MLTRVAQVTEYWNGELKISGGLAWFEAPLRLGSTGVPQAACTHFRVVGFLREMMRKHQV